MLKNILLIIGSLSLIVSSEVVNYVVCLYIYAFIYLLFLGLYNDAFNC
jgi:hypothetical protein